ncbi:hypothetical protein AB0K74_48400 [Streptomyces sp. NPDC056159]|uniref:hypothetical protein n=1 Tax=Streptomyces sp. NPDC056159 TaxID=3155537 RepID=UPI0034249FA3
MTPPRDGSEDERQVTTRPSGGRAATATLGRWARGPVTAVAARELRTCTRDLQRFHFVCFALGYALVFCLLPLAAGSTDFLPWTGLVFALWMSAVSANLYGEDGTELWGEIMIPGAARHDVRGRQLGWLLVTAPPTLLLTLVPAALSGASVPWLWLVTFVPALLGGAAGVTVLVSVLRPVPLRDPHRRTGGLLENGTDFTQVLLMLLLTAATAAPALLAVRFGPAWAGPVAGPVSGALLTWLLGRVAVIRLRRTAPELLQHFRTGTPPARQRRVRAAPPPLVPAGLPALHRPAPVLARPGPGPARPRHGARRAADLRHRRHDAVLGPSGRPGRRACGHAGHGACPPLLVPGAVPAAGPAPAGDHRDDRPRPRPPDHQPRHRPVPPGAITAPALNDPPVRPSSSSLRAGGASGAVPIGPRSGARQAGPELERSGPGVSPCGT